MVVEWWYRWEAAVVVVVLVCRGVCVGDVVVGSARLYRGNCCVGMME